MNCLGWLSEVLVRLRYVVDKVMLNLIMISIECELFRCIVI